MANKQTGAQPGNTLLSWLLPPPTDFDEVPPEPTGTVTVSQKSREEAKEAARRLMGLRQAYWQRRMALGKVAREGGPSLKFESPIKPGQESLDDKAISKTDLKNASTEFAVAIASKIGTAPVEKRRAFIDGHVADLQDLLLGAAPSLLEPPRKAPALWSKRDKKHHQNPAEFIVEHYGRWMGRGLTRAHIRDLDNQLYLALANFLREVPALPSNFDLPTKDEWYERLYADRRLLNQLSEREKGLVLVAQGHRLLRIS